MEHIEKSILQFRSRLQQVRRAEGFALEEHFGEYCSTVMQKYQRNLFSRLTCKGVKILFLLY